MRVYTCEVSGRDGEILVYGEVPEEIKEKIQQISFIELWVKARKKKIVIGINNRSIRSFKDVFRFEFEDVEILEFSSIENGHYHKNNL